MHPKHLTTLEFPKVLARLAEHTSFSGGADLARALTPAIRLLEVRERLETTSEARVAARRQGRRLDRRRARHPPAGRGGSARQRARAAGSARRARHTHGRAHPEPQS